MRSSLNGSRGDPASVVPLLSALLLLAACIDRPPTAPDEAEPARPSALISDGARGGIPRFYFLPPAVPQPTFSGTFDGALSPTVRVCEWTGIACGTVVASFGGAQVKVDQAAQAYQVSWRTRDSGLDPAKSYRLQVLLGSLVLGFADIAVVQTGSQKQAIDGSQFVVVNDGSTVQIRFRIEQGATDALFRTLSVGYWHNCGLTAAGQAYCWGRNLRGGLGAGTSIPGDSRVPVPVSGGYVFSSISAGGTHTCALTADGTAYCWGGNSSGSLGDGANTDRNVPAVVSGGYVFASISAGGGHTCALTTSGAAYCWGNNFYGQLGDGTTTDRNVPAPVPGAPAFAAISAADGHTCGLTAAGVMYCWGKNEFGQLGDGSTDHHATPTPVQGAPAFAAISAAANRTCALTGGGAAYCWGWNGGPDGSGLLGDGTTETRLKPWPVAGEVVFAAMTTGTGHTCALTASGALYCWGDNSFNQFGDGTNTSRGTPWAIPSAGAFASIGGGFEHTCALRAGGAVYCWGRNNFGQLGDGTTTSRNVPTLVRLP